MPWVIVHLGLYVYNLRAFKVQKIFFFFNPPPLFFQMTVYLCSGFNSIKMTAMKSPLSLSCGHEFNICVLQNLCFFPALDKY